MKKQIILLFLFINSLGDTFAQNCQSSFDFSKSTNPNRSISINTANPKDLYSPTDGFTWECWFNLGQYNSTTLTQPAYLISAVDASLYNDIALGFNWPVNPTTLGLIFMLSDNTNGGRVIIKTNKFISGNTWHHAAAVCDYNNNKIYLYFNDTLVDSTTVVIPLANRLDNVAISIGNDDRTVKPYNGMTAPFVGMIDEVRFWKGVRTQAQIAANKNVCLPASTANLIAYYKADENTGVNSSNFMSLNYSAILNNGIGWGNQKIGLNCCPNAEIASISDRKDILVYINPSYDKLILESSYNQRALVSIYNLNGQKLIEKPILLNGKSEIDIEELSLGIYIINIENEAMNISKKIIK